MMKLHGFSSSNYYNVPKLAFLEKGIEFEEIQSYTGVSQDYKPEYLDKSPLGKVPALETPEGCISESRAILEYIERAYPQHSLLPETPFGIAKVQELSQFIELYFELVARRLIVNLLTGTQPDAVVLKEVEASLSKSVVALSKLSNFEQFAYGDQFAIAAITAACASFSSPVTVSSVCWLTAFCAASGITLANVACATSNLDCC